MGNYCCCSIKIITTEECNKSKISAATTTSDSSVHNRERSGGSRAFEIIDNYALHVYRSSRENSSLKLQYNKPSSIRKSFSYPHSLHTML